MRDCKSFQHENVFGVSLTKLNFFSWQIYINLTLEAKLQAKKLNFNLNKMYENNLQKVVTFRTTSAV